MSTPVGHHWAPRFYLRYFAIPETRQRKIPKVWVFHKEQGDPFSVAIDKIAKQRNLYSTEVEAKLADLESLMASIWGAISEKYIDIEESPIRKIMALFISLLYLRHPKTLELTKKVHEQMVKFYDTLPTNEMGNPVLDEIIVKNKVYQFDASNYKEYRNASKKDLNKMFVDNINASATTIAELLLKKRWSIVISGDPVFITSDNPVAVVHPDREVFGLDTKGTIVLFPITPCRVLFIDDLDEPEGQYYPLKTPAGVINYTIMRNAFNYMISHRSPDEVLSEICQVADAMQEEANEN